MDVTVTTKLKCAHSVSPREISGQNTLSRAYPMKLSEENSVEEDVESINMQQYKAIFRSCLHTVWEATAQDICLQLLKQIILEGWPAEQCKLLGKAAPCFSKKDELDVQDRILSVTVIIPEALWLT